jgi:hypothetical protein
MLFMWNYNAAITQMISRLVVRLRCQAHAIAFFRAARMSSIREIHHAKIGMTGNCGGVLSRTSGQDRVQATKSAPIALTKCRVAAKPLNSKQHDIGKLFRLDPADKSAQRR